MASVVAIHISPASHMPMQSVREATLVADYGLAGDRKAKVGSKRQVLLMPLEVLEGLGLSPGAVRENLTTKGIDIMALPVGARLRVGAALLEVTLACTPCALMDAVRPGLQEELRGRRGMLCRVIEGGTVHVGAPIERVEK